MTPRRILSFAATLFVTALFLALALYSVDFSKLVDALVHADYRLVLLGALVTASAYVMRTARWQRLLAPTKKIPVARLFPVLVVGFALNNLFPGRPGEFARPYWLGRREGLSRTLSFGTIVVERVADGLTLIALLAIALATFPFFGLDLPDLAEKIVLVAAAIFGAALFSMIFLLAQEDLSLALLRRLTRVIPQRFSGRLERMLESFILGLHSLRSATDLLVIALFSVTIWGFEGVSYFLILTAFHVIPPLPLRVLASGVTMAFINLGIMIPAAPGGLGPYEAAGVFALGTLHVNESTAAGIALAAHSMQYLLITGLGIALGWREGLKLIRNSGMDEDDENESVGE